MQKRNFIIGCLLVLLSSTISSALHAQSGLPLSGVVSEMSQVDGTITVGDQVFNLNSRVRVVDISGKSVGKLKNGELVVGTYIEFKSDRKKPVKNITVISIPKL